MCHHTVCDITGIDSACLYVTISDLTCLYMSSIITTIPQYLQIFSPFRFQVYTACLVNAHRQVLVLSNFKIYSLLYLTLSFIVL